MKFFVSLQVNISGKAFMRKYLLVLLFLMGCRACFATHQRAGEITYIHQDGLSYLFTITTYTYTGSPADRPEIDVSWGDGTFSTIERSVSTELGNEIKLNQYVMAHTFPAQGTYHITFEDPNRNAGIVNIPNSVNIPFFLETILVIHPFLGANSSPQLLTRPIDNGCTYVPYYHNPGAYDPDGDSLVYSLITCRGFEGIDIPGYTLPAASNYISIDSHTGDLTWDAPMTTGEFNIAILIEEFRNGVLIGSVVRDMQITIAPCNNQPPVIQTIIDTCVTSGALLQFPVSVTDDITQVVTLTATGGVFLIFPSPAFFLPSAAHPPYTQYFSWQTHCLHVKKNPYQVVFKATDNGVPVALSSFKSVFVTVVAPKPEGLVAIPAANNVSLSWLPEECANATGYFVYKRRGSYPFESDYCQTGMPEDKGYELIGTVEGCDNTTFLDDGSVMSLYHSNEYCYRIVAFFADGAESYVSDEVCIIINSDAPRLTHVDVTNTDSVAGSIWVSWQAPPVLDSAIFLPPYEYRLFRTTNLSNSYLQIYTTTTPSDTSFTDIDLNTATFGYRYRVDLWAKSADGESVLVDKSDLASSIFMNITAHDKALSLSWNDQTPWQNYSYTVFRYDESIGSYDSVGVTTENQFLDKGLENGKRYCYFILSEGAYFHPDTLLPLINRSQETCNIPIDTVPPTLPTVEVITNCEEITVKWYYPDNTVHEDVKYYTLYYRPDFQSSYVPIAIFENPNNCHSQECVFVIDTMSVIIGCFALSVTDSTGNESVLSADTCFDYDICINYLLPNIFTPNGDGVNDLFQPFPYQNIAKIDMTIYHRWGNVVFTTEDPDINWDGNDKISHQPCSEGVYYYSCDLYINALLGTIVKKIHGSISIKR